MNRLRLAWHVLMGRPLAYRIRIHIGTPVVALDSRTIFHQCVITRSITDEEEF